MLVMYGGTLLILLDEFFIGLWYFVDYIFILIGFMIMIWLYSTLHHCCSVRRSVHTENPTLLHLLYKIIIMQNYNTRNAIIMEQGKGNTREGKDF